MNFSTLIIFAAGLVLIALPLLLGLAGWVYAHRVSTNPGEQRVVPLHRKQTLPSTLLCTLAFNLTFFLQEFFLVLNKALTPGLQPTLFHNNHRWQGDNPVAALFQGTGALAIFVAGAACALLLWHRRYTSMSVQLLLFWMAYCGLFMALPQVVVGALSPQSDLGMAFAYLHLGPTAKALLALTALAALPIVALALRRLLFELADDSIDLAGARARTVFVFGTLTLPALAAIPLIILFRVPREWIEVVMVTVVVMVTGCVLIQAGAWMRTDAQPHDRPLAASIAWPLGAGVVLLLVFQLILSPGIRFY